MFKMLKPYRTAMIAALFLTLVELFVELAQPFIIAKIIDEGIIAENQSVIFGWGAVLLVCTVVAFGSGIVNSFFSSHVSHSFAFDLRERLYEKVQSLPFSVFNRMPASTYITRITNDVSQVQNTVFMALRIMLRAPLLVIGGLAMSFVVNPHLAFYLVLSVPVLVWFVAWVMKKSSFLFGKVQEQLDVVNRFMQENLTGMRLVRAYHREERVQHQFIGTSGELAKRTQSALRLTESTMPVILFFMNIGIMAVLWFGGKQIAANATSVGDVVAIINYAMRMTAALSMMSWIIMGYSRARASSARIMAVLREDDGASSEERTDCAEHIESGGIVFAHVSLRYPESEENALTDISFAVKAGERVAFLGATGSGKSSLLSLIPRLYERAEGEIRIDGKDIRSIDLESLRRQIGYVPQEARLFTGTIRENIAWGDVNASLAQIRQAASDAQIHETIERLPNGYETVVGQRGVNLSGGQKQRISIARALLRRPKILMLDDSTSALDASTEARLLACLSAYSCTTLMITQKISTAMHADTIILLDEGRLLDQGTHEELLARSPLYQRIYASQQGREAASHAKRTS